MGTSAQSSSSTSVAIERARAMSLVNENRYIDAYPLLEKIAGTLTKDVDVITHFGVAIASRSVTLADPAARKAERKRAVEVLTRAKELGMTDVNALHILDQLAPDGGDEDNFISGDPRVEAALREGENFFGRGEYQKAFTAFERALRLDPKSYEAALFLGDSLYAQRRYAESERWFAKAAAIDPDREAAHRYWGDALMSQGKVRESMDKFIDAFVAEPYSRHSWENINKVTEKVGKQLSVKTVLPPGTELFEEFIIDPKQLRSEDGTEHWLRYQEVRGEWKQQLFKKSFPGVAYRESLKERTAAMQAVAEAAIKAIGSGELKNPHHSLTNLIELYNLKLIEPYILIMMPGQEIAEDYEGYRRTDRAKIRKFLIENVFIFD